MSKVTSDLLLTAQSVEIQAAAEGKQTQPKVQIAAYSGGLMSVPGWGPICIDLANLDLGSAQIPILCDHMPTVDGVLGQGVAEVRDGKLLLSGAISATSELASKVTALAKSGFQFQASVGIEPLETMHVAREKVYHVNGQALTAPDSGFTLISKAKLREVSIVVLGADSETQVRVARLSVSSSNID